MRPLRVGFDLDGVGYVFGASVRDYLKTIDIEVADPTDEFCKTWSFFDAWGMTREEFDKHCDDGVDAGIVFGSGDAYTRPNFFDAVRRVKALGHTVVVVTHRTQGSPGNAEKNTRKWLAPVMDCIDELYFDSDKTRYNTDLFVEDNLGNYDALNEAGQLAFLIDRPWNHVEGGDARNRIKDVSEFADAVEQITNVEFFDLTLA